MVVALTTIYGSLPNQYFFREMATDTFCLGSLRLHLSKFYQNLYS